MRWLDWVVRLFVRIQGKGAVWLRQELNALAVNIPLTNGCLDELVREADEAVKRAATHSSLSYVERFRMALLERATFIQRWTGSDERLAPQEEESLQTLVKIARKYALPRRWKLSEPVAVEYRRMRPSYFQWTQDIDTGVVPQS